MSFHSLYALIRDAIDKLLEEVHVGKDLTQIDFLGALGLADGDDEEVSEFTSKCVSKQSLYDEVSSALHAISDAYSDEQLRFEANGNLFNDPVYRCAYIYLYFVSHSYIVRLFLLEAYKNSEDCRITLEKLLDSGVMKTCAVGGGPGTDVVGTILFLRELAVLKKKSRSPSPQAFRFEEYEQRPLQQSSFRNRIRSVSCPNFQLRPAADFEYGRERKQRPLYDNDVRHQTPDWETQRNFVCGREREPRRLYDVRDLRTRKSEWVVKRNHVDFEYDRERERTPLHDISDSRNQTPDWEMHRNFEYGKEGGRRPLDHISDLEMQGNYADFEYDREGRRRMLYEWEVQRNYDYRHPGDRHPLNFWRDFRDDYYTRRRSENHQSSISSIIEPDHLQLPQFRHDNPSEWEMQRNYDGSGHPGDRHSLDFWRDFRDDNYTKRRPENVPAPSSMKVPERSNLTPFHHDNPSDSYKPDTMKPVSLSSIILDNCESWRETAESTFRTLRPLCTHFGCTLQKVKYGTVDLLSKDFSDNECSALEYADVVTMVKVVSAVASGDKEEIALEAVWSLFKKLKPGCLVLYVDNSGGGSTELICGAAESVGMKQLFRKTNVECTVPRCEDKTILDFYRKKFKYETQRKAKVSAIMWKKKMKLKKFKYDTQHKAKVSAIMWKK